MPRSKNRVASRARRKKMLDYAKGYFGRRKSTYRLAKEQVENGWQSAYDHRKQKKADFRQLWIARINAAARDNGMSYSTLIHSLKVANITLDRRVLADLALNEPAGFASVVSAAKTLAAAAK